MSNRELVQWIDSVYGPSIYELLKGHGDPSVHLPFNGFNFYPVFDDLWVDKIYSAVKKARGSGLSMEELIQFLPTHSFLKFKLFELIIDFKTARTDPQKVKTIFEFFIEAIQLRAVNKNFWQDNRIREYENVDEVIASKKLVRVRDKNVSSEVGKITAGCGTLVHGLYNDFCTDFGYDVFGPYDATKQFGEGSSLFIRQFIDLKPLEIWPQKKDFPYKTIKIYSIYRNVDSQSNFIGCAMVYKQSVVDNLINFQLEIDNRFVHILEELKEVREMILKEASEHYVLYRDLGFEEQKRLWLFQLSYPFKNFFERVGVNWQPDNKMLERVKDRELVDYISSYDIPRQEFNEKFGVDYLKNIFGINCKDD